MQCKYPKIQVIMEILRFPQFVESAPDRYATLARSLEAVRAASGGRSGLPTVCFFVQLPSDGRPNAVRKLLESTRADINHVARMLNVTSLLLLGLRFYAADCGGVAKVMKLSPSICQADVLILQLEDPAGLEGLRSDAFEQLAPHQMLLVDVDACVVPVEEGKRGQREGKETVTDPRVFVLPPKSLPKGRVGLLCSYPRWLQATHSFDDITNARRRFSAVQRYLVERLRAPLMTAFNDLIDVNSDASLLLSLRRLQDIYSLLGSLCGAPTSARSVNMFAEATGFVTKVFSSSSAAAAAGRWLRALPLVKECANMANEAPRRRGKRQRDDAQAADGFDLIEDVRAPLSS